MLLSRNTLYVFAPIHDMLLSRITLYASRFTLYV